MMASDNKIIRVGIVGCGNIFSSHAQAYPDHPHAIVVGFYDQYQKSCRSMAEEHEKLYGYGQRKCGEEAGDGEIESTRNGAISLMPKRECMIG